METHKGGLKPQIFIENRGEIGPGKSGVFAADWGFSRAHSGIFRADWTHSSATGEEQKWPRKGPVWPNWRLSAEPPLGKPLLRFQDPRVVDACATVMDVLFYPGFSRGHKP